MLSDTIAAISTAMSNSGIGIVRMSGEDSFEIIQKVFKNRWNKPVIEKTNVQSHTVHYGYIVDDTQVIDEVLVLFMKGPNSFTREDTVEVDCHGGVLVMKKILEILIQYGARPAEPGEFSKRAFLNGRIDLAQAESIMDLINSSNEFAMQSSMNQLQGSVSKAIVSIRQELIHEIAFIESALDDPEHISLAGYPQKLYEIVNNSLLKVNKLIDTSEDGKILKEGIQTVIVGKPNVGKSSLLNLLLGEERAIVTDVAGTTRDILQEHISLGGICLNIIDTAGIRDSVDIVEKIGVDKSKAYLSKADLVLYIVDSSTALDENDEEIINLLQNKKVIVLLNKTDLQPITTIDMLQAKLNHTILAISAKEEKGIDEIKNAVMKLFFKGTVTFNDQVYITSVRHKTALIETSKSLNMVLTSIRNHMPEDFFSIDLMDAYEELSSIIGESVGEDLVNEIFSKFCTGK
ncbi:MAG: tRNA uridine-5-carboxymethylaminomethyl(34) synthesis GTPase MnmE [Lachnospiraceae bacterium]